MTENERWRAIAGMEGLYEISSYGRVRSLPRIVIRSNGVPNTVKGRFLKETPNKNGYFHVSLAKRGEILDRCIHILVAEAFIGPRPLGTEVAHFDGDQTNNRLGNLRYATPQGNADDRIRHGTVPKGDKHWNAKLKNADVEAIRADQRSHTVIATQYSVSESMIRFIRTRKNWAHLGSAS